MRRFHHRLVLAMAISSAPLAAQAACFDLSKSEPHELTGRLVQHIFPGPPGYEDIKAGDAPEPTYILTLPQRICLTGDEMADPAVMFSDVHLVGEDRTWPLLAALNGKSVVVKLERPMPAHTGHHHAPLVAWVADARPAAKSDAALSVVNDFYAALSKGDGDAAAKLVVPEKRNKPPFSAGTLSGFYGNLASPLDLVDLKQTGNHEFLAHYRYRAGNKSCDGKAVVATTKRRGADFIKAIHALDGC